MSNFFLLRFVMVIPKSSTMTQLMWITLLILFSLKAWSFEYQVEESSLLRPSILQISQLSQKFESKGYRTLSSRSLISSGLSFDTAYTSEDWNKVFLIKAGLQVPSSMDGKLLNDDKLGVIAVHIRVDNTPYLILSMNNSQEEIRSVLGSWIKPGNASAKWSLFVPSAQAAACETGPSAMSSLKSAAAHIEGNEIFQKIGKCATDALSGVQSSVTGTLDFFKKLATDPKALWAEMKESFVQLKNFAMNIQSELQTAFANLKGLSTEQKTQMACTLAGTVMGGAVQSMLVGGALAKILPGLLLKVKESAALLKKISSLEQMGIRFPDKSLLAREVLSCAY